MATGCLPTEFTQTATPGPPRPAQHRPTVPQHALTRRRPPILSPPPEARRERRRPPRSPPPHTGALSLAPAEPAAAGRCWRPRCGPGRPLRRVLRAPQVCRCFSLVSCTPGPMRGSPPATSLLAAWPALLADHLSGRPCPTRLPAALAAAAAALWPRMRWATTSRRLRGSRPTPPATAACPRASRRVCSLCWARSGDCRARLLLPGVSRGGLVGGRAASCRRRTRRRTSPNL